MDLNENNLREIEGLSQRGQTLSIVDLIKANTLNIDMAAYALYAISKGASFLTAARPGNAGKTTLLACLLAFLPPEVQIVTISDPSIIKTITPGKNLCILCHEIGSGHWYGYLWGKYVGQLFELMGYGCQIASCIHADTLPEMRNILVSKELGVLDDNFSRLGLILFMRLQREAIGYKRRVATFYENNHDTGTHEKIFSYEESSDTFKPNNRIHAENDIRKCKAFIESIMENTDFRWVRQQVLDFYRNSLT